MNLRILKKLSKRAGSLLPLLGDHREQFLSESGDNYHGMLIRERKHWERCPSVHADCIRQGEVVIAPRCRSGSRWPFVKIYPPSHPWPRTMMVGGMSGYYEPEWDEECAWLALDNIVRNHFCDWDEDGPTPTRRFRTPGDIFRGAAEIIATNQPGAGQRVESAG